MASMKLYEGILQDLPQEESRTVRIFFSSTFTDFTVERNYLMKNAVPKLQKYCQEHNLEFQIVDMRWGVRDEAAIGHLTTDLCLEEVRKCERISRGPYFVAFLGDKYGFRPFPAQIPESEYKILKNAADRLKTDVSLLETWYKKDENSAPPVYIIQHITSILKYYSDDSPENELLRKKDVEEWKSIERRITNLLRLLASEATKVGEMNPNVLHRYMKSVTEDEIDVGILQSPSIDNRVLCFMRTIHNIDLSSHIAKRFTDLLPDGDIDKEAQNLLYSLTQTKLPNAIKENQILRYPINWDDNGINELDEEHTEYLQTLNADFISKLTSMIESATSITSALVDKNLHDEVLHHLVFCKTKCETFCGRANILKSIKDSLVIEFNDIGNEMKEDKSVDDDDYRLAEKERNALNEQEKLGKATKELGIIFNFGDAHDIESDPNFDIKAQFIALPKIEIFRKPLVIYGQSGSGKTAIMARVAELSKTWFPNSFCVIRFLGTSPKSSAINDVLTSVCEQIWKLYPVNKPTSIDINNDFNFLMQYFMALLWQIKDDAKPLVICLDSVDQLLPDHHAYLFNWLPVKIPPNVFLIISMIPDLHGCLENAKAILNDESRFIEVPALPEATTSDIIDQYLTNKNRHLTRKQKQFLLEKCMQCPQPLFLKLQIDMALKWSSLTGVSAVKMGESIRESIDLLFDSLEKIHGEILVKKAFGYLAASSSGLSDLEMEDILSIDDEVLQDTYLYHLPPDPNVIRLPPLLWKRVQNDIKDYLVERQVDGRQVIAWYHRLFTETAKQRYYLNCTDTLSLHLVLTQYFEGRWSEDIKPLELYKRKKGMYPHAIRQVQAQPLHYGQNIFNLRKLREYPTQLFHSKQYSVLCEKVLCNFEWLLSKCTAFSLSGVLNDLNMFLHDKQEDKSAYYEDIEFLSNLLRLSSEVIRKSYAFLPLQLIGYLGPRYKGSELMETLLKHATEWSENTAVPLMVPQLKCLPEISGLLIANIEVDVFFLGGNKPKNNTCIYFHERKNRLYIIEEQSRQKDKVKVYDMKGDYSCIKQENLNIYLKEVKYVGNDRFLHHRIYKQLDSYSPVYSDQLYMGSSLLGVKLPYMTTVVTVHEDGQLVVCLTSDPKCYICQVVLRKGITELKVVQELALQSPAVSAVISPDGRHVVLKHSVYYSFWSLENGDNIGSFPEDTTGMFYFGSTKDDYSKLMYVTKSNMLLCPGLGHKLNKVLWGININTAKLEWSAEGKSYTIGIISVENNEEFVLTGISESVIINGNIKKHAKVYDLSSGKQVSEVTEPNGPYEDVKLFVNGGGNFIVIAAASSELWILSAGTKAAILPETVLIYKLLGHDDTLLQFEVKSDLSLLMTAGKDRTVKIWNFELILNQYIEQDMKIEKISLVTKENLDIKDDHVDILNVSSSNIAVTKDGEKIYAATNCGDILVVCGKTHRILKTIHLPSKNDVEHMMVSSDGDSLIVVEKRETAYIYSTETDELRHTFIIKQFKLDCIAESNNVLVIGSAGMNGEGRAFNVKTGELMMEFQALYSMSKTAVHPSGTKALGSMFEFPLVMALTDDETEVMDDSLRPDCMMSGATSACFSPNGMMAAMGASDGSIRILKLINSKWKYCIKLQQRSSALQVVFTQDSKCFLSTGFKSVWMWSPENGDMLCKLTRHANYVPCIKLACNDKFFITSSLDKSIILWDFQLRESLCSFNTHCEIREFEIPDDLRYIAYRPLKAGPVSVIKPNKMLRQILSGQFTKKVSHTEKDAQALALAFSTQKVIDESSSSKLCEIS